MALNLSPEDYDYISLRVKKEQTNHLYKIVGFWLAVVTIIAAFSVHVFVKNYARKQADVYIERIIKSEEFKQTYIDELMTQVNQINKNHRIINQRLIESELFKNLPYKISEGSFEVADTGGDRFVVEAGIATINQTVVFKKTFSQTPVLLISNHDPNAGMVTSYARVGLLNVIEITERQFKVSAKDARGNTEFAWVAIGN